MHGLLGVHLLVERLVRPGEADRLVLEEHEALEVDLLHADVGGDPDELGQLADRLLEPGKPRRDLGKRMALALLDLAEALHVVEDAGEIVLAADRKVRGRVRRVERHAHLVEPASIIARPLRSVSSVPFVLKSV